MGETYALRYAGRMRATWPSWRREWRGCRAVPCGRVPKLCMASSWLYTHAGAHQRRTFQARAARRTDFRCVRALASRKFVQCAVVTIRNSARSNVPNSLRPVSCFDLRAAPAQRSTGETVQYLNTVPVSEACAGDGDLHVFGAVHVTTTSTGGRRAQRRRDHLLAQHKLDPSGFSDPNTCCLCQFLTACMRRDLTGRRERHKAIA
jgi:hypothetical protein